MFQTTAQQLLQVPALFVPAADPFCDTAHGRLVALLMPMQPVKLVLAMTIADFNMALRLWCVMLIVSTSPVDRDDLR